MGPLAAKLAGRRYVAGRRDMGIWYTHANLRVLRLLAPLVDRVIANSHAVKELVSNKEGIPDSRIDVVIFQFHRHGPSQQVTPLTTTSTPARS